MQRDYSLFLDDLNSIMERVDENLDDYTKFNIDLIEENEYSFLADWEMNKHDKIQKIITIDNSNNSIRWKEFSDNYSNYESDSKSMYSSEEESEFGIYESQKWYSKSMKTVFYDNLNFLKEQELFIILLE